MNRALIVQECGSGHVLRGHLRRSGHGFCLGLTSSLLRARPGLSFACGRVMRIRHVHGTCRNGAFVPAATLNWRVRDSMENGRMGYMKEWSMDSALKNLASEKSTLPT